MKRFVAILVIAVLFSSCGIFGLLQGEKRTKAPERIITLTEEKEKETTPDTVRVFVNAFSPQDLVKKADSIRRKRARIEKERAEKARTAVKEEPKQTETTPVFFEPPQEDTTHTITVKAGEEELFKVKVKPKNNE